MDDTVGHSKENFEKDANELLSAFEPKDTASVPPRRPFRASGTCLCVVEDEDGGFVPTRS